MSKIIQIMEASGWIYGLGDNGTMYRYKMGDVHSDENDDPIVTPARWVPIIESPAGESDGR